MGKREGWEREGRRNKTTGANWELDRNQWNSTDANRFGIRLDLRLKSNSNKGFWKLKLKSEIEFGYDWNSEFRLNLEFDCRCDRELNLIRNSVGDEIEVVFHWR